MKTTRGRYETQIWRRWLAAVCLGFLLVTLFGIWQDRRYERVTVNPSPDVVRWLQTGERPR